MPSQPDMSVSPQERWHAGPAFQWIVEFGHVPAFHEIVFVLTEQAEMARWDISNAQIDSDARVLYDWIMNDDDEGFLYDEP